MTPRHTSISQFLGCLLWLTIGGTLMAVLACLAWAVKAGWLG